MKLWKWLYTLIAGHILIESRLKSIDEHIAIINGEMGDIAKTQARQGEDIAYIKGRLHQ